MSRRAVPVKLTASPSSVPFPQAVDRFTKATIILLRIQARIDAEEKAHEGKRSDLEEDQAADVAGSETTS